MRPLHLALLASAALLWISLAGPPAASVARAGDPPPPPQPPRVPVPKAWIEPDDGDSLTIRWPEGREVVRLLGIDAPETCHPEHDLPYPQPFGEEARGFLCGALAVAEQVELLRAGQKDVYGRTLAYVYLDGKNASVLLVEARLAVETVSHFGDNDLPGPAAEVLAAARAAGPVAFEAPHRYRARMRDVARHLRAEGRYPGSAPDSASPPEQAGAR